MRRTFATLAALGLSLATRPLAAEVVSLPTLEHAAVQNRPALAADAARTTAAHAELDKAHSAYYPRLLLQAQSMAMPGGKTVVLDHGYRVLGARVLGDGLEAFAPRLQNQLNLGLTAPIYDFGRTRAAIDAGRARFASSEAQEEATRAAIVQNVRAAYLAWLSASELHTIAAQAATESANRRIRVEALIEEGARPHAELTPARADELLTKLELERARGDRDAAKLELDHAVGAKLPDTAEPDRGLLERDTEIRLPASDAPLRALEEQRTAASANARAQDKLDAPLLSGSALAGVRSSGFTPFPVYAVGVNLSWPLWDAGEARASAAGARAQADAIAAEIHDHEQRRNAEFERAQLDANNATARLMTARALLEVCEQREREASESYELGAGTLDQLTQARALLRRARTEVVLARVSRAEAGLRLQAAPAP